LTTSTSTIVFDSDGQVRACRSDEDCARRAAAMALKKPPAEAAQA
jgi:hypothetical protein